MAPMRRSQGRGEKQVSAFGVVAGVGGAVALGALLAGTYALLPVSAAGGWALYNNRSRKLERLQPVTLAEAHAHADSEGRFQSASALLQRIRESGIDPSARPLLWPLALGALEWHATDAERELASSHLSDNFWRLRSDVSQRVELGDSTFLRNQRIAWLDACRTALPAPQPLDDASMLPPTPGDASEAVASSEQPHERTLLRAQSLGHARLRWARQLACLLECQSILDEDLGYCQGMNEVAAAFVAVLDLPLALECFKRFVRSFRRCFEIAEGGVNVQLELVADVLESVDTELMQRLRQLECGDLKFGYRMIAVLLQRELKPGDQVDMWEQLFVDDSSLLLYAVAAAITKRRKEYIYKCRSSADVWELAVSQKEDLDAHEIIAEARKLRDIDGRLNHAGCSFDAALAV